MKSVVIWLILFFLFCVEGGIMPWLLPIELSTQISPHLMLVVIIYYGIYVHRYHAMALGLAFGFLHDVIYYSYMLGLFTFAMGLIGYLAGLLVRSPNPGYPQAMMLMTGCLLFFEVIVETYYNLFRIAQEPMIWILVHKVIPSTLFNGLFALAIYFPVRFLINKLVLQIAEEETA